MWILAFKDWQINTPSSKSIQTEKTKFSYFDKMRGDKTRYFAPKIEITKAIFAVDLDRHCGDQSQTDVPIGETIYFSDQNYPEYKGLSSWALWKRGLDEDNSYLILEKENYTIFNFILCKFLGGMKKYF